MLSDDDKSTAETSTTCSESVDETSLAFGSFCSPLCSVSPFIGTAFDVVLVRAPSGAVACGELMFRFHPAVVGTHENTNLSNYTVLLEVDTTNSGYQRYPIVDGKLLRAYQDTDVMFERLSQTPTEHSPFALESLAASLQPGANRARYVLQPKDASTVLCVCPTSIHLWSNDERVIVIDIDGTITKSNVRGVVDTIFTESYSYIHAGVCRFFSSLPKFRFVYLTSRPMSLANTTRKFLTELRQHDHNMPQGALLGFSGSLTQVLFMEIVTRSTNEFKTNVLMNHVVYPFAQVGENDVFFAGFGNTLMDIQAYHMVGMQPHKIFLIDKQSRIQVMMDADGDAGTNGPQFHGYHDDSLLEHILEEELVTSTAS